MSHAHVAGKGIAPPPVRRAVALQVQEGLDALLHRHPRSPLAPQLARLRRVLAAELWGDRCCYGHPADQPWPTCSACHSGPTAGGPMANGQVRP